MTRSEEELYRAYEEAAAAYELLEVDVDEALERMERLSLSIHCWQRDDAAGVDNPQGLYKGEYPCKPRTIEELRQDIEKVVSLVPGNHRFSLHAIYGDFDGQFVDRNQIELCHYQSWIDWAKRVGVKLDFNSTFFSHPKSTDGYTLSHPDPEIRAFWMEHLRRCREISAEIGRQQGDPCTHNIWIPDGTKDKTVSRSFYRERLEESLDTVFAEKMNPKYIKECLECKRVCVGSECYLVGSHEFCLGYAVKNSMMITLDAGYFHPAELISDKISSVLLFVPEFNLHVNRPECWNSGHAVILNDELLTLSQEVVRSLQTERVHLGLDFFDASVNCIGSYVVGLRSTQKAMLQAFLEPTYTLRNFDLMGKNFQRMAYLEELKAMPWSAVYDYYCYREGVAVGRDYIQEVEHYEELVTSQRGSSHMPDLA